MRPRRITGPPPRARRGGSGSPASPRSARPRRRTRSGAPAPLAPAARRADRRRSCPRSRPRPRASRSAPPRSRAGTSPPPGRGSGRAAPAAGPPTRRRAPAPPRTPRSRRSRGGRARSPSPQLVVERVALHRNAPRVPHHPHELLELLLGRRRPPRRMEDLLPDDRPLHVVGAEVQGDLRQRHPHHDPVGLHVGDVVEEQARDGDRLQVLGARRVPPPAPLEDRVLGVERERDEREEPAARVLLRAQPQQVVDPLLVRLDVAVQHRALGRDPEPVCGVVDVEPLVGVLLPGSDQAADAVGEDLGAAAGERPEPRVLQLAEHLLVREAGELRHVVDLGGGVELEVHVRQRRPQLAQDVDVEVEVDVWVLAVHAVDLREPRGLVLAYRVLDELLRGQRVRVLLLVRLREGAELALHPADVRLVQVEVLDEEDAVVAAPQAPREVGQLPQGEQVVRLEEREPVLEVEPLAPLDLVADRRQSVDAVEDGHHKSRFTTASVSASSSSRRGAPFRQARARSAYSSARSRERSSASVAATRTSAPSSGPPARARRTTASCRAASSNGSVGVPSRRSVPATLPVSIVSPEQSRTSSTIWNAIPSASPKAPSPPPPSRHAASKSFPVLRAHRSRYASIVVSGSWVWLRWSASPRARQRAAPARVETACASPVAASSANARAKR